jgi:hypothetical protein
VPLYLNKKTTKLVHELILIFSMGYFVNFKGLFSKNESTKKTSVFLVVMKTSVANKVGLFLFNVGHLFSSGN